jgi:hypothetical protein
MMTTTTMVSHFSGKMFPKKNNLQSYYVWWGHHLQYTVLDTYLISQKREFTKRPTAGASQTERERLYGRCQISCNKSKLNHSSLKKISKYLTMQNIFMSPTRRKIQLKKNDIKVFKR